MTPGLRSAAILASARLFRHWPAAARLPTPAQFAAWPSLDGRLSAIAPRLSTVCPVGRYLCHLASCRRAVAVPAAASRRPSRPVRCAAGNAQLSRAKVWRALAGFPCFAAIRLARAPAFRPAVSFRACAASRRSGKCERRRRLPSSAAFAFPFHATAPVPWRASVALSSDWLHYSVPHSLS